MHDGLLADMQLESDQRPLENHRRVSKVGKCSSLTGDSSNNAALLVFRPGWGFRDLHGYQVMDGTALPGAGRDDEANSVTTQLPDTGRYLVEIATARGDAASYGLRLTVR